MPRGLLSVEGAIELKQFWPEGGSDADTTKLVLTIEKGAFRFKPFGQKNFRTTKVFDGARVRGRQGTKPAVAVSKTTGERSVTVRLQGIDAPELHAQPSRVASLGGTKTQHKAFLNFNEKYRQHYAETATVAFARKLAKLSTNGTSVKVTVLSRVDDPNQVFDTYGRVVGNVIVHHAGKDTDVNHWLVQQGWAYPSFYASMENDEIEVLLKKAKSAAKKAVPKALSARVDRFDPKLVFESGKKRKQNPKPPKTDTGPVVFPKIFRRQAAWYAHRESGIFGGTLKEYIARLSDYALLLEEFLLQHQDAENHPLAEFIEGNKFAPRPEDLVFRDAASTLISQSGKVITKWW